MVIESPVLKINLITFRRFSAVFGGFSAVLLIDDQRDKYAKRGAERCQRRKITFFSQSHDSQSISYEAVGEQKTFFGGNHPKNASYEYQISIISKRFSDRF